MKFHRPLLVAGLASIGSVLFVAQAQNNEAQTKALDALRKAQGGQGMVAAPAPSAIRSADTSKQEKALEALRGQQPAKPMPMPAMKPMPVVAAPVAAPNAMPVSGGSAQERALQALRSGQPTGAYTPASVSNTPAQNHAIEALRRQQETKMMAAPSKVPAKSTPEQKRAVNALKDRQEARAEAAAAPVAVSRTLSPKEEKLADLTRRYKADQISPREYHAQRAKIIAEP
jgi:hypothetical protein